MVTQGSVTLASTNTGKRQTVTTKGLRPLSAKVGVQVQVSTLQAVFFSDSTRAVINRCLCTLNCAPLLPDSIIAQVQALIMLPWSVKNASGFASLECLGLHTPQSSVRSSSAHSVLTILTRPTILTVLQQVPSITCQSPRPR